MNQDWRLEAAKDGSNHQHLLQQQIGPGCGGPQEQAGVNILPKKGQIRGMGWKFQ